MRSILLAALLMTGVASVHADEACRSVDVTFEPAAHLQIAVWVEDLHGNYVDTIWLTRSTGALGLGNRPGNAMFKSGYRWPYGRREMVLPVWAHKHNHTYGYIVMGGAIGVDPYDDSIAYHERYSSPEPFYCSPSSQPLDAVSCASAFVGSKGLYQQGKTSLYPPRADLSSFSSGTDSADAKSFAQANDVAAISGATPPGNVVISPPLRWVVPATLPSGEYVIRVEASLEGDFNSHHHYPSFPDVHSEWAYIGNDAIGQPSVVYAVPIAIDGSDRVATTDDWQGYGSWDGSSGAVNPPDSTISDSPGSGAGRLLHVTDGDGTWRVKVQAGACAGATPPAAPAELTATPADTTVRIDFRAPPSADPLDLPARYDIRYRASTPLDDGNFADGIPAESPPTPGTPGAMQTVTLTGLKAETHYYIGIRSVNGAGDSPGVYTSATTLKQKFVTLHGCFIATAAYGSPLAKELGPLRRFRDQVLLESALGRLGVATYYTFSPPIARALTTNEHLRAGARRLIAPLVVLAAGHR